MKVGGKIFLGFVGLIALIMVMELAFGWFGVFYTKTVKVEQENADREVFEQTQSYVEGKRQEALKFYKEWREAETESEKKGIENMVMHSFANFDDEKLQGDVRVFVEHCKYGSPAPN